MNKLVVFIFSVLMIGYTSSFSQTTDADKLLGVWEVGSGKARVKIEKYGDKYMGKIVWLREPKYPDGTAKVDKNNPDV